MPKLLKTPFAAEAEAGFRTDIQESTGAAPNSATYQVGFPPITMQSIASSGMPPKGSDLNGVLYDITDNLVFLTQGGGYGFDSTYATSIGGYPLNARLRLTNGDIVKSTINGNTNNPNSDMTGWVNFESDQQEVNNFVKDKTISFLDFGAKGDGVTDDSVSIGLASTWSSMYKRKVSGLDKEYKCSNVFFDSNCYLADAKLVNNADKDLISVLTTSVSRDWLENVTFENIHINGMRQNARTIKTATTAEDGGRHGFRFRRPCRNIWIIDSSANYCASDGCCIFPDWSNGGLVESVQNFNIINSEFNWNRRHGGSNDRTNGLNFTNVKLNHNGIYLTPSDASLPNTDGRNGDKNPSGDYYGNGWDSEEYDDATISQNLTFLNCEGIGNARGGLLVLATDGAQTPSTPTNIKIIGGRYDKGVLNTAGNFAITVTPNGLTNTNQVYQNTVIDSVSCTDDISLRNNFNFSVTNTPCRLFAVEQTSGFVDDKITYLESSVTSNTKRLDGSKYGMFSYTSNTKTINGLSRVVNIYADAESKTEEFKVSTFKFGEIETTVDSATDSTTWKFKTGGVNAERFRIGKYGAQLRVSGSIPDSALINESIVFEYVSNTVLKIKMKGSDGVVRSTTLTLT